ncbi:DUF7260 family protein [Halorubrum lipolyticum]|uniref:DUF7260 domain-containing protein n=1 Tax=Halorubrum lipolyticum DSM 21995 TaxID=1227482 RepID=M0NPI4_9EURY|nr:hypothetical protein [Halorubrum lipolyticum]EMA59691.1 hypothetical protein C469_10226 [Halorubrum lipolyticum DSM 21995]
MSVRSGATAVFGVRDAESATGDCGGLACEFAGIATDPSVVTGLVFVGMGVLVACAYVRTASEECRCERRRLLNERDAFDAFADRVAALDTVSAESSTAVAGGASTRLHQSIGARNATDVTLRQVVSIYKETVMSVSHYEAEYDETVTENMAAELGQDTTASLATNGTLFSPAQRALVDRAHEAAAARTSLADAVETELDALSDAETRLTAIDRRRRRLVEHVAEVNGDKTDAALDVWNRLDDLETEIEAVTTERQQSLRELPLRVDRARFDAGGMGFYDYLYGATEGPRHPVLSQAAELAATVREDRDGIASRIADGG